LLIRAPRWASAIGCSLTAAFLAGGCGASDATAARTPAPAEAVGVVLTEYQFTPNPIEARAGVTTFRLMNEGRTAHDFTILSADGHHRLAQSALIAPGTSASLTTRLQVGSYPVICTQPGHQEAGMEAVLRVAPAR
jgi:uncharacterized cupredoxin-like copper-binding protein